MDCLSKVKDIFVEIYVNRLRSVSFPYTFLLTIVCGIILLRDLRITKASFKYAVPKLLIEIVLSCTAAILIQCIAFAILGNSIFVYHLTVLICLVLYALFRSNYNYYTRITMTAIFYLASWSIWRLVNGLFLTNELIFPNGPIAARDVLSMLRITVITVIVVILLKRFSERKSKRVPPVYWLLILFISIASVVTFIIIDSVIGTSGYPNFSTYIAVIFLAINLLTYYMFYVMTTEHIKNTELQLLNQRTDDENAAMEKNEQLYQNIRAIRHDLKNHVSFMQTLLAKKEYDTLDKYFRQLTNDDYAPLQTIDCGNQVLNTILNNELMIAKNRGIHFETFIGVPAVLSVKDKDICSLLTNIIDNAFEAAAQSRIPVVELSMKIVNDFLFIKCKNSMAENVFVTNPELRTTKSNNTEHGLGIKVIRSIAERYSGETVFEEQDGSFVVTVMLMLPDDTENGGSNGTA